MDFLEVPYGVLRLLQEDLSCLDGKSDLFSVNFYCSPLVFIVKRCILSNNDKYRRKSEVKNIVTKSSAVAVPLDAPPFPFLDGLFATGGIGDLGCCWPWIPVMLRIGFFIGMSVTQTTPLVRISGILASVPGFFLHILLFFQLAKLLGLWEQGHILDESNVRCFSRLGVYYLWGGSDRGAAADILFIALSISNPPGTRQFSLGLSSDDLSSVAVGLFLWLVAYVLQQAYLLKREADLTV
jgi:hypothetical protein